MTNAVLAFAYGAASRLTNEAQTVGTASPVSVGCQYQADGCRSWLTESVRGQVGTLHITTLPFAVAGSWPNRAAPPALDSEGDTG